MSSATPLIIEVAINGSTTKEDNPNVPLSADEMVRDILDAARLGGSIFHVHGAAVWEEIVEGNGHDVYIEVFTRVLAEAPGLINYPTMPANGVLEGNARFRHAARLIEQGVAGMIPCDPVTINWGTFDPAGTRPDVIYRNTMSETAYVFGLCRALSTGCTLSIFEPGGLALALAHHRNGTLPKGTIVKLEFSAGQLLFGLPPTPTALSAYLEMMDGSGLPWMVTLRGGDLNGQFARHVISQGGHVRVGLEDFSGPRQPTNAQLVSEIVAITRGLGRPVADPATARAIIGL